MNNFIMYMNLEFLYGRNRLIWYISKIPVIKKLLPKSPYGKNSSHLFTNIIQVLNVVKDIILGNLSVFMFLILPVFVMESTNIKDIAAPIYLLWGALLAFMNCLISVSLVHGSSDITFTLVHHIHMDAKSIIRSKQIKYFTEVIVNRLVLFIFLPPIVVISLIFIRMFISYLYDTFLLFYFDKTGKDQYKQGIVLTIFGITMFCWFLSLFLYKYMAIAPNPSYAMIGCIVSLILLVATFALFTYKCNRVDLYGYLKSYLLRTNIQKPDEMQVRTEAFTKQISKGDEIVQGHGFELLNKAFFTRHKSLWKRRFVTSIICAVILVIAVGVSIYMSMSGDDLGIENPSQVINKLSFLLLIQYYLNFGETITSSLFMNCDSSLLRYRSYNSGGNVIKNLIVRIKYIVRLHLPQILLFSSIVIVVLYGIVGVKDLGILSCAFLAFLGSGIFFCLHTLVLYYLLQPYDSSMKMRDYKYSLATFGTYMAVYGLGQIEVNFVIFTLSILGFTLLYFVASTILLYKFAPKTFRLK